MQGTNHLALGLLAPVASHAVLATPEPLSLLAWGALVVGSLLPDIDGDGEIVRWGNWLPNVVPSFIRDTLNWTGLTVSGFIKGMFGHRGPCHWAVWGVALIAASLGYQENDILLWLGIGFLLHLLGDIVTIQGVPLFGPVYTGKISIFPMRVGGWFETGLGYLMWLALGAILAYPTVVLWLN